jgi:hypothetical protein
MGSEPSWLGAMHILPPHATRHGDPDRHLISPNGPSDPDRDLAGEGKVALFLSPTFKPGLLFREGPVFWFPRADVVGRWDPLHFSGIFFRRCHFSFPRNYEPGGPPGILTRRPVHEVGGAHPNRFDRSSRPLALWGR